MVLVIMWVLAVVALLGLMIAWGATIDDDATSYARSGRPMRRASRRVASIASR